MPSNLEQGHTYLRITTATPSSLDLASFSGNAAPCIVYVGPVGELPDEHVFEVKTNDGQAIDPAGQFWSSQGAGVVDGLKGKGIKAEVLAHKQRAKRDEF
jgi:hypothetical protein